MKRFFSLILAALIALPLLADGSLTRQQLQINASRVYRMAKELTGK